MTVLMSLYHCTVHSSQDLRPSALLPCAVHDEGRGSLVPRLLPLLTSTKNFLHRAHRGSLGGVRTVAMKESNKCGKRLTGHTSGM